MRQRSSVAQRILDAAVARHTEAASVDADTVGVVLGVQQGVAKNQRGVGAAGGIVAGADSCAADVERQCRRTTGGDYRDSLAQADRGVDHVAGVEHAADIATGRAESHVGDARHVGIDQVAGVVGDRVVAQRGGIANGVTQRGQTGRAVRDSETVGADADTVGVVLRVKNGVVENQFRAAAARDVVSVDRAATDIERQLRLATADGRDGCGLAHGERDMDKVAGVEHTAIDAGG